MARELFRLEGDSDRGPLRGTVGESYQARYGLTRHDAWALPANTVGLGIAVATVGSGVAGPLGIIAAAAFGGMIVPRLVQLAARWPAMCVDAEGVTFGRPAPGRRDRTVPWQDIIAIYVWRTGGPWGGWHVGLHRRSASTRDSEPGEEPLRRQWRAVSVPESVPRQVSYDGRKANGWRLDPDRLAEAVARFSPQTEVKVC